MVTVTFGIFIQSDSYNTQNKVIVLDLYLWSWKAVCRPFPALFLFVSHSFKPRKLFFRLLHIHKLSLSTVPLLQQDLLMKTVQISHSGDLFLEFAPVELLAKISLRFKIEKNSCHRCRLLGLEQRILIFTLRKVYPSLDGVFFSLLFNFHRSVFIGGMVHGKIFKI